MITFTEDELQALRERVGQILSRNRYIHVLSVEEEVAKMGDVYLPDCVTALRAAALLHDITKEMTVAEQIALCRDTETPLTEEQLRYEPTLHEKSAPARIRKEFPAFAVPEVLEAVRVHTTGGSHMSVFDKLVFLADYTEAGRVHADCVHTRERFHRALAKKGASLSLLNTTVLEVLQATLRRLISKGYPVEPQTLNAYNAVCYEIRREGE